MATNGNPPDNNSGHQLAAEQEVQNYLDLLLSSATEKPAAQASAMPERHVQDWQRPVLTEVTRPLTVVARPTQSQPGDSQPSDSQSTQSRSGSSQPKDVLSEADQPSNGPPSHSTEDTLRATISAAPVAVKTELRRRSDQPLIHERRLDQAGTATVSKPFAEPIKSPPMALPVLPAARAVPVSLAPAQSLQAPANEGRNLLEADIAKAPAVDKLTEECSSAPATLRSSAAAETELPVSTQKDVDPSTDQTVDSDATPDVDQWLANGRPAWAQQRFECLLFTVGGLTLAVPLVELGTIYQLNDEITPIFGQVDWLMGLLPVNGANIRTINTAKVVMPERYKEDMQAQYRFVITLNGVDWGLAVDAVSTAIKIQPEDVRWRSERSARAWLAGTVVEHMCALLDVSQLTKMFVAQQR